MQPTPSFCRLIGRFVLTVLFAAVFAGHWASTALAQNQGCAQIVANINAIQANPNYTSYNGIVQELNSRQQQVRQAEQQWMGSGCQDILNRGQAIPRQCQSIAQVITSGRNQVQQLQNMAQEGQNLSNRYQALARDYQQFGCEAGQRGSLLDDMFGGNGGQDYFGPGIDPWSSQQTRRTVCVRTADGFYWPISFSTTDQYIAQDAIKCHEMCPGQQVALFSYRNPGEEPEDMISLSGAPYRSMPYAFRFREEVDMSASCRPRTQPGSIDTLDDGGSAQSIVSLDSVDFPLPLPDPRGDFIETVVADAVYVPLPRPRPREDGTAAAGLAQPQVQNDQMRIVEFGDREVRLIGPETPYVPAAEEES